MKKLLLVLIVIVGIANLNAQHSVTLKVIDNQDGALTNNVDDNNETNVFCWAGNDSGTLYDGDWWYPMYDGETGRTGGSLMKDNGVWTWQCTFTDVAPGDYKWNPHMKTLGWNSINTLYTYGAEANLYFSVGTDGTISGQTTLELPLTATSSEFQTKDNMEVYAREKTIVISHVKEGGEILIFNLSGKLVAQTKVYSNIIKVTVDRAGIYLVKSSSLTRKVLIK